MICYTMHREVVMTVNMGASLQKKSALQKKSDHNAFYCHGVFNPQNFLYERKVQHENLG